MVDLVKKGLVKSVDILSKKDYEDIGYFCASPEVIFDFSSTNFDEGAIKYKIGEGDWGITSVN